MSTDYSEDRLIQKSAAELMETELGWTSVYAYDKEVLGENSTLGRNSFHEVLLIQRFRLALKKLNPWINDKQIAEAIERMTERMSSQTLMQINEQKYQFIRDGIPVTRIKQDGTSEEIKAVVIDFENADNNDFLCVRELWVYGALYRRRADIVGFVNGIPLLFVELKNHNVEVENAFNENYRDYLDTIPQLFYHNAFIIFSNGLEARVGTIDSKWKFFHEWKRLTELDNGNIELPTMLRGICKKENFLDLLENYILYDHSDGKTVKIMARNHQYLGVNQAVEMYKNREYVNGKLGVFWHTQGSGKSYSMLFLACKIRRKFAGSPTIVILTDREELNKQISDTFENCGVLGNVKAKSFIASSGDDLITKLKGNPSFIFSLIQKFNKPDAEPIYPDHDIIVISDEAHRTQNGVFAENLLHLLPTANRIGFTGTPLLRDDNITARTFGGYVSIYDFKRAVDDKATVPLYYENRGERLKELKNPEINEEIAAVLEQAGEIDASQQAKLEREFAKEVHLLTAPKRLRIVAQDFVSHYSDLWTSGKAMVVCYNKVTCVRMYNYVQEYWQKEIESLEKQISKSTYQQEVQELKRKLDWMQQTEMAVVVSQEQNEIQTFRKWGLDILPHREKMEKRELDKEFKNTENPLRVVFVCAMWLTGFDVKSLSCLYIDKPMKAHTLMQTIARANRVADGKDNGLIIDYIGIVKALRKALADYTASPEGGAGSNDPTIDKQELIKHVAETISAATAFLKEHDFELQELIDADTFLKLSLLRTGADTVCEPIEIRKSYCTYITTLLKLWKFLDRDDITQEMKQSKDALEAIYKELQKKRKHADITNLSVAINAIVDEHLELDADNIVAESGSNRRFDISKIDFDLLRREFAKKKEKNLIMKDIQELLQERIAQMMAANPSRINFYEKYQEIIHNYNAEQNRASIEKTFEDLIHLTEELSEEEKRYLREGFENDEQLSLYDVLFKDDLSKEDIKKLKKVAKDLLGKIKSMLKTMDHPFDKQETKASIVIAIRDLLWQELPESYSDESITYYRDAVFNYISQRYGGVA
ncbi:type I restriction endonuclease subunit R [Phocaeicola massiliensis]|jgi:type I restriction enzyme R subunit|uniref:type I restriction endonuclease subunit R n=1 Tax=Phocaeicola massiliensis TaxID=204516 RepID=UPI0018989589|nr:type I restriction endonuclease subunit R [Phocaeicola massiliensis]